MDKCNRLFGGHTAEEVADLLDGLCRSADRCEANSQQEIAAIAARGRDALRALLAKPAATREAIIPFFKERGWEIDDTPESSGGIDDLLAALSYFAPPARSRMMIEGMSEHDIWVEAAHEPDWSDACGAGIQGHVVARVAHRLATTPAPEVDPDAEAKRLAWEHYRNSYETGADPHHKDQESLWGVFTEQNRNGWRAVVAAKKEAGGE